VTDDLKKYRRKTQATDFLISFFRTLILIGLSFVILYPIIYMISCSFRERSDMNDPTVMWIPRNFTLDIIKETIEAMNFGETLYNTLVLNIGCCIVQVMSCAVTGYGFARFKFRGKKLMLGILIFMILVPVQVISLPLYTQFRYFGIKGVFSVNLIDTFACMYLPALLGNGIRSGLIILIFMQFFKGLPKELEDAACLDGCSPFGAFIRVMLPNSISFIITAFLFSIVFYWNDSYVSSTFFTNNQTIGLMLKNLDSHLSMMLFNDASVQISPREQIVWMQAGCLISITPLLILYCYLQKYFTESIVNSGIVS
jgi:multiple sugar transport system permease protein